ncbi:unnamed protein product [Pelagomonas calceolata]|uniref:Uncharacterized protein n=1 Tax=Pelagomonas calceolata TaxID=35677 RepID=A0A8J2WZZ2_9STRA|nr:unnamed protein product [Pelagomonas calceolata]
MAAVTVDGTVVEEEKVDLEIPQEKVDVKKADEAEPESAGGCDVCLPPNGLIGCGAYDYKYLCLPSMPWSRGGVAPPQFLGKDARLPLLLALVMGFQHALAMVAGIATSGGMLIAGDTCFPWQYDSAMCEAQNYLVSAAWITSGILTIIQVFRAKIRGTPYYLGTGLLSVMGTSFTFLPIAREMVARCVEIKILRRVQSPSDANDFDTTCAAVSGVFTPAVTESETTRTCANDNGRCCNHYNKREDSHRTTLIILLKTPYAIGTIAALFLHLLLPEDRVLDEEKEHYPRAFSDGEIAYET